MHVPDGCDVPGVEPGQPGGGGGGHGSGVWWERKSWCEETWQGAERQGKYNHLKEWYNH